MDIQIAGALGTLVVLLLLWAIGALVALAARRLGVQTADLLKRWAETIVLAIQQQYPDWDGPAKKAAAVKWIVARARSAGLLWVREPVVGAFVEAAVKTLKAALGDKWRPATGPPAAAAPA